MFGMPLSRTHNGDAGMGGYEYGEYECLMDVEAILHTTPGSPSSPAVCSDRANGDGGQNEIFRSLHGDSRSGNAAAPLGRGTPRKPVRGGADSTRNGESETAIPSSTATTPRFAGVIAESNAEGAAPPTRNSVRKPTQMDEVVHLPAISSQQPARRKANDVFPARLRAAAPAQDPAKSATSPTHNAYSRAAKTGANSMTSAGNLSSIPAPTESYGVIASNPYNGSATAGTHKPPYHAPPLSTVSVHNHQKLQEPNSTKAVGNEPSGSSASAIDSKTNGWVKEEARRLDELTSLTRVTGLPATSDTQEAKDTVNCFRSRNPTHPSGHLSSLDRMKEKTQKSEGNANTPSTDARNAGASTSPAPAAPKPPVWIGDYEMDNSYGAGSGDLSAGQSPKVATSRLLANGVKLPTDIEHDSKNMRSSAKSTALPTTQILYPTPSEAKSSAPGNDAMETRELATAPIRRVFTRPQKPALNNGGAVAQTGHSTCPVPPVPPTHPSTSPTTAAINSPPRSSGVAPDCTAGSSRQVPPKVTQASDLTAPAAAGDKQYTSLHTSNASHRRIMNAVDTNQQSLAHSRNARDQASSIDGTGDRTLRSPAAASEKGLPYSDERRAALEAWADVPVLTITIRGQSPTLIQQAREDAMMRARPPNVKQMHAPLSGQGRQEIAGEPCDMNYDVHNVVVQLRHRNRPLMMNYPPRLPLELDMRPRLRRQRTPSSFYGKGMSHVGDAWFRDALKDAPMVKSPDLETLEKREEAEFIRNGGDPTTRRNRYGKANNAPAQQQPRPRPPQQHNGGGLAAGGDIDVMNRNILRTQQTAP